MQVLMPPEPDLAAGLPDELPGQSNCAEAGFGHHDAAANRAAAASPASLFGGVWSSSNPAVSGLSLGQTQLQAASAPDNGVRPLLPADWLAASPSRLPSLRPSCGKPVLNEVVCGTLMLAYERAGLWEQVRVHGSRHGPSRGGCVPNLLTPGLQVPLRQFMHGHFVSVAHLCPDMCTLLRDDSGSTGSTSSKCCSRS